MRNEGRIQTQLCMRTCLRRVTMCCMYTGFVIAGLDDADLQAYVVVDHRSPPCTMTGAHGHSHVCKPVSEHVCTHLARVRRNRRDHQCFSSCFVLSDCDPYFSTPMPVIRQVYSLRPAPLSKPLPLQAIKPGSFADSTASLQPFASQCRSQHTPS